MKVLQFGKFYHPYKGGVETLLRALSVGLKERGVDIRCLVANTRFATVTEAVEGIEVRRVASLGSLFSTSLCPTMPLHVGRYDADIIHIHQPNPLADISCLLRKPRSKLVISYHSDIIKQRYAYKIYKFFLRKILKRAEKIVVATPAHVTHSAMLQEFREKCEVIHYGINLDRFKKNGTISTRIEEIRNTYGKKIVLFVGRLVYYKGLDRLIDAMRELDAVLLIVGTGPLEKRLRQQADSAGLADRTVFLRETGDEELAAYYHACDVFCLPSVERSEAFGIVQLEAMACGKPVVSTNVPSGVPYVNHDGVTGLTVEPGDIAALHGALQRLLEDEDTATAFGTAGRERVQKEFTEEQMIDNYFNLYQKILE